MISQMYFILAPVRFFGNYSTERLMYLEVLCVPAISLETEPTKQKIGSGGSYSIMQVYIPRKHALNSQAV